MENNENVVQKEIKKVEEKPIKKNKIKSKKKTIILIIILMLVILGVFAAVFILAKPKTPKLKELPKPEITSGARGELGIDKNINESTIDEYLGRPDSVYRDMRMLEDPSKYENIGGDRFLSGYIDGFEVIPLPYIIPVTGLPEEVGDTYIGKTLFYEENGKYIANYEESMEIIEEIFPKDKVIFLMCGGGGYAGMTKNFLVSLGWDENKIYNVGGHWYYKGKNNIEVPKKEVNGQMTYDFSNVPYHEIKFDKLTKSANYREPKYKVNELKISTGKIEIEEGTTFKLNVIVLPNEAENKEVKWTSKDETIAKVSEDGTVTGIKEGKTTVTVESVEGKKTAVCEVTIKKKPAPPKVKIDNLTSDANEFNSLDFKKAYQDFQSIVYDENGYIKEEYSFVRESDGMRVANDLYDQENAKYIQKIENMRDKKTQIINRLIDNKKSFIILLHAPTCDDGSFQVANTAEKILKANGYSYFYVDGDYEDGTLENSKLDKNALVGGSIIIMKNGNVNSYVDPNIDSLNNEADVRNWLDKYIELKY